MNFKKISKIGSKLRINKRGVSPIIATLLLVAIAVAASVITYTWVMTMTANQAQKSQTQIAIDQVFFGRNSTNYAVAIGVRNAGSVPATIQTITIMQGDTIVVRASTSSTIQAAASSVIGVTNATAASSWANNPLTTGTLGFTSGNAQIPFPDTVVPNMTFQVGLAVNTPYTVSVQTNNGFTAQGTFYSPGAW